MPRIIIDPGHGGNDVGDIYGNRLEKDDNLKLALAIGEILQNKYGYEVVFTRLIDTYLSQFDRVNAVNNMDGDLLLSVHRIIGELPANRRGGLGFYINEYGGFDEFVANNIAENLEELGFEEASITLRSILPILRDTDLPAVILGLGYLNSDYDNEFFDNNLEAIAEAIADGIHESFQSREESQAESVGSNTMKGIDMEENKTKVRIEQNRYRIQVGLFRNYEYALGLMTRLFRSGYPGEIQRLDGLYSVFVGDFTDMDAAVELERRLRREGYNTLLITF